MILICKHSNCGYLYIQQKEYSAENHKRKCAKYIVRTGKGSLRYRQNFVQHMKKNNPEQNRFQTLQSVDFKSLPQYHSLPGNTVVHQEKITSYYICIDPMFACIRLVTACPTFYNDGILSVSNLIHGSWKAYQNVVFFCFLNLTSLFYNL